MFSPAVHCTAFFFGRFVRIGHITTAAGLRLRWPDGRTQALDARSYDHFAPVS